MKKNTQRPARRNSGQKANESGYQNLESRQLLAGISFDSGTGVVTVDGSSAPDTVLVSPNGTQISVVLVGLQSQSFNASSVNEVVFTGREGNDFFRNDTSKKARAYGQSGDDTLLGGSANDVLHGGPGADSLFGNGGDDALIGDVGDDLMRGGIGNDWLDAGSGNDRMFGEDGADSLLGSDGDDNGDGGSGPDRLFGYNGKDNLRGGSGDDVIAGQSNDDTVYGDDGNDKIYGNDGVDVLWGLNGDDLVAGGSGNDSVYGSSGSDMLFGDDGVDQMFGDSGDDGLFGGLGNDKLYGQSGKDLVMGGSGDDNLQGNDDIDQVYGESGNDDMYGGSSDDVMRGGSGSDRMSGDDGSDDMDGESDSDDLNGGALGDRMRGGSGNDDFTSESSDDVLDDSEDYSPNGDFEIRGVVSNLDTNAKTFTLLGFTVNYAGARVEGSLANGAFFKAEGSFAANVLTAHEVEQKSPADSNDNFEARGVVSGLDSNNQTFQMLGLTVNYAAAQVHGSLADGVTVKVEGILSGTTVNAREVQNGAGQDDNQGDRNIELRGAITGLDTNAMTFSILGFSVNYSSAQVIGSLANGSFVKVDGSFNGTLVTAREIEPEDDGDDENIELIGAVGNLNTSTKTFDLFGIQVSYANAEIVNPFDNGTVVEVEGLFANSKITAHKIR